MSRIEFTINGKNAYSIFGITLDETSLGALMTPPPMKERVSSNSRLEHGVRVVTNDTPYVDSRDLTLQINISASSQSDFLSKYALFCEELKTGVLDISVLGTTYHCLYLSCQQFSQFMRGIGKFVLRLQEYNPSNR